MWGGGYQNRVISLLDQLGGREAPTLLSPMPVATACRCSTGWVERTVTSSDGKGTTAVSKQFPTTAAGTARLLPAAARVPLARIQQPTSFTVIV